MVEETVDRVVRVGGANGRGSSLGVGVKGHMSIPKQKPETNCEAHKFAFTLRLNIFERNFIHSRHK